MMFGLRCEWRLECKKPAAWSRGFSVARRNHHRPLLMSRYNFTAEGWLGLEAWKIMMTLT
jgi:hypothetical protein